MSLIGISEAAADCIVNLMKSKSSLLESRLNQDSLTPNLTPVAVNQILLGDPINIQPYMFWISTIAGGSEGGLELTSNAELFGGDRGTDFYNTYRATISVYLPPDTQNDSNDAVNQALRHRLLSRASDWIRFDCFNRTESVILQLTSQEYTSGINFDQMKGCMIESISRGEAPKGKGRTVWCPCIRHNFIASIA